MHDNWYTWYRERAVGGGPAAQGSNERQGVAMELKQRTYYELTYREFDALIRREFGRADYEVVAEEEWSNDSGHTTTVRLDWYNDYDKQGVAAWLGGTHDRAPSWGNLLAELAQRKVVPEGDYLISVSW